MYVAQYTNKEPIATRNYQMNKKEHCVVVLRKDGMVLLEISYYNMNVETKKATVYLFKRNKKGQKHNMAVFGGGMRFDGTIDDYRAVPVRCEKLEEYIEKGALYESPYKPGYYYYAVPIDDIDLTREDFEIIS